MDTAVTVEGGRAWAGRSIREVVDAVLPPSIAVAMAALLSVPRLGSRTMWLDEVYTVGATNQLLDTWRETGGTQALYYVLVWPVSRLSTDPVWMRLPSVAFALVAVVVVYEVGRRIGGRAMGGLAAGGLALSWGLARYAVEARSYTLSLLLVSVSWLALTALVQDGTSGAARRWWRVFVVAVLLAPLAHGLAALHFVAQVAALAVAPAGRRWLRSMALVAVALAVELAALAALGVGEVGDWVEPLHLGQVRAITRLMLGFGFGGAVVGLLVAVAVWTVAWSYWRDRGPDAWCRVVPAFWALGPPFLLVLLSLVRPYAASRYVFAALPGFLLLVAGLVIRLRPRWARAVASLAIALLLLTSQGRVTTEGLEDWAGLTACLATNAVDGDRLATAHSHRPPLDYYWPRDEQPPTVEPLSPLDPLGEVRRLYRKPSGEIRDLLLGDTTSSVWYVERGRFGRAYIAAYAFNVEIAESYKLSEPWFFQGDLTLVRFDPVAKVRPGPEGSAPCDTVPPPA